MVRSAWATRTSSRARQKRLLLRGSPSFPGRHHSVNYAAMFWQPPLSTLSEVETESSNPGQATKKLAALNGLTRIADPDLSAGGPGGIRDISSPTAPSAGGRGRRHHPGRRGLQFLRWLDLVQVVELVEHLGHGPGQAGKDPHQGGDAADRRRRRPVHRHPPGLFPKAGPDG